MTVASYHWSLDTLLSPWASSAVPAVAVSGVNLDSRMVEAGDAYLAVAGAITHGMRFAEMAADAGAVAVVCSNEYLAEFADVVSRLEVRNVPVVFVDQLEGFCGAIASRCYHEPDKAMTMVAVTGTDGKSSVCRFIAQALNANHQCCGYIGTLGWGLGDALEETALTTPDSVTLRRLLANMRDQGAKFIALEASSHGIAEGRLDGLSLDVAVLTNLGRDHLDYHGSIEAYRAAKERLFYWDTLRAVVLNADDAMGRELIMQMTHLTCISYSTACGSLVETDTGPVTRSHTVTAKNILTDDSGLSFDLLHSDSDSDSARHVSTTLLGRFNVENLLACYGSLLACGVAANDAIHCIAGVTPVAGRMERLGGGDKPTVVIDYSHTPNALQVAIKAVRVHCLKQLWVVFGCGGDRDKGKRAPMASAAEAADHVVLTDDNPRTERSGAIISDVMQGFRHPDKVTIIADRANAIQHALTHAVAGDLVLIAGKGHEDYQVIGTRKQHFSDREQALAVLGLAS